MLLLVSLPGTSLSSPSSCGEFCGYGGLAPQSLFHLGATSTQPRRRGEVGMNQPTPDMPAVTGGAEGQREEAEPVTGFLPVVPERVCSLSSSALIWGRPPDVSCHPDSHLSPQEGGDFPPPPRAWDSRLICPGELLSLNGAGPFKVGASPGPDRYWSEFPARRPR